MAPGRVQDDTCSDTLPPERCTAHVVRCAGFGMIVNWYGADYAWRDRQHELLDLALLCRRAGRYRRQYSLASMQLLCSRHDCLAPDLQDR